MPQANPRKDEGAATTDWARLNAMTDDDIQRGIDSDPDAAPALTPEEIKTAYTPAPPRIPR